MKEKKTFAEKHPKINFFNRITVIDRNGDSSGITC